jgi:phage protein U
MKYILYVVLTVFLENGEPSKHEFKLSFDEAKHCIEMKKVVDVGVSFFRLAHKSQINYEGKCKKQQWHITKKRSL